MLLCDLNCDTAEGTGNEDSLLPFITSANIACGFHAGDEDTMKRVVDLCLQHGVRIGAHPSYRDRENFGRIDLMGISVQPADVHSLVAEQVYALQKITRERGADLHHVKPHGALYNRAARDPDVAQTICIAVREVDPALTLYGLSGSLMGEAALFYGLKFMHEVFADRTYREDGSLTPRTEKNALIDDEEEALSQALRLVQHGEVRSVNGKSVRMKAETICIHGDGKHAVHFARILHQHLRKS
jgi:UPF0271 protein